MILQCYAGLWKCQEEMRDNLLIFPAVAQILAIAFKCLKTGRMRRRALLLPGTARRPALPALACQCYTPPLLRVLKEHSWLRCGCVRLVVVCWLPGAGNFRVRRLPVLPRRMRKPQRTRLLPSAAAIHPAARQARKGVRALPAERHALLRDHGLELPGPVPDAADPLRRPAAQPGDQRHLASALLQAVIVMSLFVLVLQLTQLPFDAYDHHISLQYGLSVQHWGSWFGDWGKGLLLGMLFASILGWILYARVAPQPAPLVVLLLAGDHPHCRYRPVRRAGLDRAAVQQIRAAHRSSRRPGSADRASRASRAAWTSRPSACSR